MDIHTQFSSGNCDNQICLQQQLQVQETDISGGWLSDKCENSYR